MDQYLQWLLVGLGFVLLAGWLGWRASKRAAAKRKSKRAFADMAARAEAQRAAAEAAAREKAKLRAAEQDAVRAETARLAQARAARAEALRQAAVEAARVEQARIAAQEAARAEAVRAAAQEAARARAQASEEAARRVAAARLVAEETQRAQAAARAAAQEAARLDAERHAAALVPAPSTPTPAAKTPDQPLVMIADDSKIVRVKTGRLLAQHQYRVSYATDGLDAAQQLQSTIPDLVITDVEMPGMDGFELARHVRQNPLTAHVPVIMITAANDRHREDADRAGVSVLLGKPYEDDELMAYVRLATNRDEAPGRAFSMTKH